MHETLQRLGLGRQRVGKETFYWWLDLFCIPVNAFKKGSWWAEASIVMFCLQWPEEMSQPGLCTMQWEIAVGHWGGAICGDDVAVYYNPINWIKKGKKINLKLVIWKEASSRIAQIVFPWNGIPFCEKDHGLGKKSTTTSSGSPHLLLCLLLCYVLLKYKWEGKAHMVEKGKKNLVEGGKKDILTPLCSAQKTMYLFGVP